MSEPSLANQSESSRAVPPRPLSSLPLTVAPDPTASHSTESAQTLESDLLEPVRGTKTEQAAVSSSSQGAGSSQQPPSGGPSVSTTHATITSLPTTQEVPSLEKEMQKIRVEDAQAKHPPDEPRVGGFGIARKQDSEETKISGLDETTPEAPIQSNARTDAASEENEEEWLLKSIQWPPLPPRPSSSPTQSFETSDLRTKIIQQNRNGPCSLIALCNVLILRDDLHIPPGRDRVTYSYLSTLLADFFLRITSTSPVPPVSAVPENDPTLQSNARQLSLEAALSILPQTRYGLNLNPQFSRIDGFTTSASSGQGELALFSLAQIPLLNGWIADPADQETFEVLTEAKDYDRAVEMMVEGSEIAGRLGLQGQGGDDLSEDELLKEAERRSQWTSEEEAKVRKAHLIDRFLDLTSTQLTYPGLFALSSTPTFLPPAGLAALFRNSHLSVIYRRPRTPTANELSAQTRGPELFALVTDSSFAGEEEIVWESIEDVDGSASEFFTAGLERSRARGGDFAGVRRVEDVPESTSRRNELADLALAQQLQAEEEHEAEEYERAEHIRQVQRAQQQETATSARRPSDPRAHATSAGGRTEAGKAKSKAEKDKCLIM